MSSQANSSDLGKNTSMDFNDSYPKPKEEPPIYTENDLIAILSLHNLDFKEDPKTGEPRMPTQEEASSPEALRILKTSRKRMVCRIWPRDPKGKYITPANSFLGKSTPNGIQLWGSTLFDFYRVRRIPDLWGLSTISTGSKLIKWMKANGELNYAKDEIEWGEMEDEPKRIDSWFPCEEIKEMEEKITEGKAGISMSKVDTKEKQVPTGSLFDSGNYSSPWPLVPFSYETECLTSAIDLDLLPKKLVVHDPWNVLAVDSTNAFGEAESYNGEEWTSKQDRTHVYKLQLSKHGVARAQRDAVERAKLQTSESSFNEFLNLPTEGLVPGPIEPPILIVRRPLPHAPAPAPNLPEPIKEAHLYLSPAHPIGKGNHSVVYQAEWELPRSAVVPTPSTNYVLCNLCVVADIARIIREEDGEHGERKDPKWTRRGGEVKIIPQGRPSVVFHAIQSHNLDKPDVPDEGQFRTENTTTYRVEYVGPVRRVHTTVEWHDPRHPTCEHVKPPPEVPPTVKMRVVGKTSLKYDRHLVNEAANYEAFEKHFFEHWSGLNVLPPMHDPVPVGALVPQYYGYYVPVQDCDEDKDEDAEDTDGNSSAGTGTSPGYLSPILLLEDCGTIINPNPLTHDQRTEALSLIYRFHFAGWAHGSVYHRNILTQPGPLSMPPSKRSKDTPSFRLIDFGRSYHVDNTNFKKSEWMGDRFSEETSMKKLFDMNSF